jgi:hypothetical protein
MEVGDHLFLVDTVAKMHRYLRVAGFFQPQDGFEILGVFEENPQHILS